MHLAKFCLGFFLIVIVSFTTIGLGQESLGDAARRIRSEKATRQEQPTIGTSSPAHKKPLATSNRNESQSLSVDLAALERMVAPEYMAVISRLFAEERWEELETIAASARQSRSRFLGGGWRLYTFYVGLCASPCDGSEESLRESIQHLQRWAAKDPQSATAQVALADKYYDYAWIARGNGYADLVSAESWKLYKERIGLAREALETARQLKTKCPHWFAVMQKVARGQGWELQQIRASLNEAIAFEPKYYYTYLEYAFTLQPKWMGEEGDPEHFAEEIANKLGGKEGAEVYYRVANRLTCTGCAESASTFGRMSWDRIKEGYSAIAEHYGAAPHQVNEIARLAVMAKDRSVAQGAFLQIGDRWDENVWHTLEYFQAAKAWATEAPIEFKTAWTAAAGAARTPDGAEYSIRVRAEFESRNAAVLKGCEESTKDSGEFDVALKLAKSGEIQDVKQWPPTKLSECVIPKLSKATFAPPPSDNYWILIPINFKPEESIIGGEVYPQVDSASVATGEFSESDLRSDTGTDVNAMAKYRAGVQNLLAQQRFDELEKLANSDRAEKSRFKGGVWKLYVFYQGLKQPAEGPSASDDEWKRHMNALAMWSAAVPDSDTAQIALAEALIMYARHMMTTVQTGDYEKRIQSTLHLAQLLLKQAADHGTRCPHWDFVNLELEERENKQLAEESFKRAVKKEPTYFPYYRLHALYQRPEWGLKGVHAEEVVDAIANGAGEKEGDIIYFEVAAALNISPSTKASKVVNLSWPRIKRGYAALEAEYGKSMTQANQFAHLAMRSRQLEDSEEVLTLIGNQWDPDTWWTKEYFDYAKAYVRPSPEIREIRRAAMGGSTTTAGHDYQETLTRELLPQIARGFSSCVDRKPQGPLNGFDLLFRIAKDGSVLDFRAWPETKFTKCFVPTVSLPKLKFSPPPEGTEWVGVPELPMPDISN